MAIWLREVSNLELLVRKLYFETVSYEEVFPRNFGAGGVKKFPWKISSGAQSEHLGPSLRAVLMGTKSCTKILNFSTRFSCENFAVEDFVLWGKNLVDGEILCLGMISEYLYMLYGEKILLMGKSYAWA